jgi:hypothetical protein
MAWVCRYDRQFRVQPRDIMLTSEAVYIVGLEKVERVVQGKKRVRVIFILIYSIWSPHQRFIDLQMVLEEALKRRVPLEELQGIAVSTRQDDFVVIQVADFDTPIETVLKTEFLTMLAEKFRAKTQRDLTVRWAFFPACSNPGI